MIKASELRIGNWLLDFEGNPHLVWLLDQRPKSQNEEIWINTLSPSEHPEHFRPIELSPEILEACGFVKDEEQLLEPVATGYTLDFSDKISGACEHKIFAMVNVDGRKYARYTVNDYHGSNNMQHLHQLQNLYYSLTGSELTVNLTQKV